MTRLAATLFTDLRLQFRNGFYAVTAFIILVWGVVFLRMPHLDLHAVMAGLVLGNLAISTFYYMAALVLLEKGEGTLEAQTLSPLRDYEYLLSKLVSLVGLATLENLVIVMIVYGLDFNVLLLVAGTALSSALLCLAGFLAVTRYTSINAFLFPSVLIVLLVELPLFDYFGLVDTPLVYLHPLQAPLTLMRAAFEPVSTGELIYGCAVSLLSLDLLLHLSQRALRRFVTQQPGEERAQ